MKSVKLLSLILSSCAVQSFSLQALSDLFFQSASSNTLSPYPAEPPAEPVKEPGAASSQGTLHRFLGLDDYQNLGDQPIGNDLLFSCGSESDIGRFHYLHISPSRPKCGQSMIINGSVEVDEPIINGTSAHVIVKLGIIKLLEKDFDVCEEVQRVNMTCPLEKGSYSLVQNVDIPREVPPGKYNLHAQVYSHDKKKVVCLRGSVTLSL